MEGTLEEIIHFLKVEELKDSPFKERIEEYLKVKPTISKNRNVELINVLDETDSFAKRIGEKFTLTRASNGLSTIMVDSKKGVYHCLEQYFKKCVFKLI